jgi:hypothetical protein
VLEEEIFHAGFVAGVAEDVRVAKHCGDSADDGDDLMPANEDVERDGEMGLRREASADAEGEAEFGSGVWRVRSGEGGVTRGVCAVFRGSEERFLRSAVGMTGCGEA